MKLLIVNTLPTDDPRLCQLYKRWGEPYPTIE